MKKLSVRNGDYVVITSEAGEITIPVTVNDSLMNGTIVVPHGLPDVNVNKLISSAVQYIEPISGMHRMVGHRVAIRKVES